MKGVSGGESVSAFESEKRRNQTNLVVIADASTNPDSVSPGAEHVIHAARWGISLLCVAVANWGKKGSAEQE